MKLPKSVVRNVIEEIRADVRDCIHICDDFSLKCTPFAVGKLYVRYRRMNNAESFDDLEENYRWICLDEEGKRTSCDPQFENVTDENQYKTSMSTLMHWQNLP